MFYCCTDAFCEGYGVTCASTLQLRRSGLSLSLLLGLDAPPKFGASRKYFDTAISFDMTACFDVGKPRALLLFGFEFIELGNQPLHFCMIIHLLARKPFPFQLLLQNSNFISNCLDLRLQVAPISRRTCWSSRRCSCWLRSCGSRGCCCAALEFVELCYKLLDLIMFIDLLATEAFTFELLF